MAKIFTRIDTWTEQQMKDSWGSELRNKLKTLLLLQVIERTIRKDRMFITAVYVDMEKALDRIYG